MNHGPKGLHSKRPGTLLRFGSGVLQTRSPIRRRFPRQGGKSDRNTPAFECWSLGVRDGQSDPAGWRLDDCLSESRAHTACLVLDGSIHTFGGQSGDVPAIIGSTEFLCNFETPHDVCYNAVFTFNPATNVQTDLAPIPLALWHTVNSSFTLGNQVLKMPP